MMYSLVMKNASGAATPLRYDTARNAVMAENGEELRPEKPAEKRRQSRQVRLALGKDCNYACAYCRQRQSGKRDAAPADPAELVEAIREFHGEPSDCNVQFWGGEPALYFGLIKKLHRLFYERGAREFSTVTNGTLLKGESFSWLMDNDIDVSLSHDGPGQHLRGKDPLGDQEILGNVLRMLKEKKGRLGFSAVLTSESCDHGAILEYFRNVAGHGDVRINEGCPVMVTDELSAKCAVPEDRLPDYARALHRGLVTGELKPFGIPYRAAVNFLESLGRSGAGMRKCACYVGDPGTLVVDPAGNILTCSSFTASDADESGDRHLLGSVFAKKRAAPPLTRLVARHNGRCGDCPARWICRGGCPFIPDKYLEYHCREKYHTSLAILGLALHMLTGDVLTEVRLV